MFKESWRESQIEKNKEFEDGGKEQATESDATPLKPTTCSTSNSGGRGAKRKNEKDDDPASWRTTLSSRPAPCARLTG